MDEEGSWWSEAVLDVPGYVALEAAADHARRTYLRALEEVRQERLPTVLAALDAGEELVFDRFGITQDGFRYETDITPWRNIGSMAMKFDHLAVHDLLHAAKRQLDYGDLDLVERLLLAEAAQAARERATKNEQNEMEYEPDEEEVKWESDT
jgi:hypothetical protein